MNEKTKGIKRIRFSGNKQTNIHTYIQRITKLIQRL